MSPLQLALVLIGAGIFLWGMSRFLDVIKPK